jgi:hypothetical protein
MAKVINNVITQGLSGTLGNQIVFRAGKGGQTIVATKPVATERDFNAIQLAHQEAFRNAILYAKSAKDEAVYLTKAQGTTMSAFNAAVADWFNKPEVLEIDADAWTGDIGQIIRVKAQDDTFVAGVHIVIHDESNNIFEQGDAVQADGLWWEYTSTTQVSGEAGPIVSATVVDLPGNSHELTWQNN